MILLLDNYDSFTYNLYDYFLQLGQECRVLRNDETDLAGIESMRPDAVVFSPGPQKPEQAGIMMELIGARYQQLPMLGICLGFQAIGLHFGAQLIKAAEPVYGKTALVEHDHSELFKQVPDPFTVMRYHSLILTAIEKTDLIVCGQTQNNIPMAIRHPHLPLFGFQFHPESVMTKHGLKLLSNWLDLVGLNHS